MNETITFQKIVPEGKALGYADGRACFALGPLPGETARVRIDKAKKNYLEASVLEIVEASQRRAPAVEDHFLSCSPWQGVDYGYQLELKKQMLIEIYGRPELKLPVKAMLGAPHELGYRNKLEFSVKPQASNPENLELAFHARSSRTDLLALPAGCALGSRAMNRAALALIARLNELEVGPRLETVTVRQSQASGEILAVAAFTELPKRDWSSLALPEAAGVVVSRLHGRASHELVWQSGRADLTERIGGIDLEYPFNGFFQTNVPMFEQALEQVLAAVMPGSSVVDLYGGVGTIGLPAASIARMVTGIEINAASVEQANNNAWRNKIGNYRAVAAPAEHLDEKLLADSNCVILDPPRAGLDRRVIGYLQAAAPERIIYLSCNPATQARDLMLLSDHYRATSVTGFDFYPGTVHLESLVVLDRVA